MGGDEGWSLTASEGLRVLRAGTAEGTLAGGCLSILAESLGTPYSMLPASAEEPRILYLEDIGTKPYQWDRMLLHLRYAGLMEHVSGIVFGDMRQCVAKEDEAMLEAAILYSLRDFAGPIAIGLRSGHVDGANVTLPLGVRVRLEMEAAGNPRMDFLEAAVAV
jgi:muramoyltetrapeptide carboxypeptidase